MRLPPHTLPPEKLSLQRRLRASSAIQNRMIGFETVVIICMSALTDGDEPNLVLINAARYSLLAVEFAQTSEASPMRHELQGMEQGQRPTYTPRANSATICC